MCISLKARVFFLVSLLFITGFAFCSVLSVSSVSVSDSLVYERPLPDLKTDGFRIFGEDSRVYCDVGKCSYVFRAENVDLTDFSALVKPFFTGEVKDVVVSELLETQSTVGRDVCVEWGKSPVEDLNGEVVETVYCAKMERHETTAYSLSEVALPNVKSSETLGAFEKASNVDAGLLKVNESRVFKVTFTPIDKTGELLLVAVDKDNPVKLGSLDPPYSTNWANFRVVSFCAGSVNADANALTPWNIQRSLLGSDSNDIRWVYRFGTNDFDLNHYLVDWNTSLDANIQGDLRIPFPIKAGECSPTTDVNGALKVYYNNAGSSLRTSAKDPWSPFLNYEMYQLPQDAVPNWATTGAPAGTPLSVLMDGNAGASGQILMTRNATNHDAFTSSYGFTAAGLTTFKIRYKMITCAEADDTSELEVGANPSTQYWQGNFCNYIKDEQDPANLTPLKQDVNFNTLWFTWNGTQAKVYQDWNNLNNYAAVSIANRIGWYFGSANATETKAVWDYIRVAEDGNYAPLGMRVGNQQNNSGADFNYSFRSGINYLDAENSINQVIVDFNDISIVATPPPVDWNWFSNGVLFSTDQNTFRTLTTAGDYNILLRVKDTGGNDSNTLKVINVIQAIQGLAVDLNEASVITTDFNVTATFLLTKTSGVSDYNVWYLNGIIQGTGISKTLTFSIAGDQNICVIAKTTGIDVNKQACYLYGTKVLRLINEDTGAIFDLNKLAAAQVFTYDGNLIVDLKDLNQTVLFWPANYDVLRFDFTYLDTASTKISREITQSLLPSDTNVGVCVAEFQTLYEQIFESAEQKEIILYNDFAKCYSLVSYTKFAYKNVLANKAYTIAKPYYLYTFFGTTKTLLSLIDGTIASEVNLDVLEFNQTGTELRVGNEFIGIGNKFTNGILDVNILQISYSNNALSNTSTTLSIYQGVNLLFSTIENASPNDFVINWNYTAFSIDDNEQLKLVITSVKTDGSSETNTYYFRIIGDIYQSDNYGFVMIIVAFILMIFGLTLTAERFSLGWFGILICLIALGIMSIAPMQWYIKFFIALIIIVLAYIFLIYRNENARLT